MFVCNVQLQVVDFPFILLCFESHLDFSLFQTLSRHSQYRLIIHRFCILINPFVPTHIHTRVKQHRCIISSRNPHNCYLVVLSRTTGYEPKLDLILIQP